MASCVGDMVVTLKLDADVVAALQALIADGIIDSMPYAELLKLRDEVNRAIYDREKKGLME